MSEDKRDHLVMVITDALDKIRAEHEQELAGIRASLAAAQRERDEARREAEKWKKALLSKSSEA